MRSRTIAYASPTPTITLPARQRCPVEPYTDERMASAAWSKSARWTLAMRFLCEENSVRVHVNGELQDVRTGIPLIFEAGWRVTIPPMLSHEFWAASDYAIVGEVSTANDDATDNFFANPDVGRFSVIDEDEPAIVKLVSD